MARDIDVLHLLNSFATRNKLTEIVYNQFAQAVQRQAQHYDQNEALYRDLWLHPDMILIPKLFTLAREKRIVISATENRIETIFLPEGFTNVISAEYLRMEDNAEIPFPNEDAMKLAIPSEWVLMVDVESDLPNLLEKEPNKTIPFYRLMFPNALNSVIILSNRIDSKLLIYAVQKIQVFLRKGANKDYIQQRMMGAFVGKERKLRDTLNSVLIRPNDTAMGIINTDSDFVYPFWAYLTSAIRKDSIGKKELSPDEIAANQATYIVDVYNNHYKNKAQRLVERDSAFKTLTGFLHKAPFLFTIDNITDFRDIQSRPLLGKYSRDELENWLHEKTTDAEEGKLPELLIVQVQNAANRFIAKDCFLQYLVSNVDEVRPALKLEITQEWKKALQDFVHTPEMDDDASFHLMLEEKLIAAKPLLGAIIFSPYAHLVYFEMLSTFPNSERLSEWFTADGIAPVEDLLSLDRKSLLSDTKIMLPFWYSTPILSWIVSLFLGKKKKKIEDKNKKAKQQQAKQQQEQNQVSSSKVVQSSSNRAVEFKKAALLAEKSMVPEGISIESQMSDLENRWNNMLNPTAKANLTEDIKSLVRDCMRRVLRTMKPSEFTVSRIENLASKIVTSPNLQKLHDHKALKEFICLYMIQVLKK